MSHPKFCMGCGAPITPEDRFCGACGRRVESVAVGSAPTATRKGHLGRAWLWGFGATVILVAAAYGGSAWYIGDKVADTLQAGKTIPLADGLAYRVEAFQPGWFQSRATGQLVLDVHGRSTPLLTLDQRISQGLGSGGTWVRVRTVLPPSSALLNHLAGPQSPVDWQNPQTPVQLQSSVGFLGARQTVFRLSGGSILQSGWQLRWHGVYLQGRQTETGGVMRFHLTQVALQDPQLPLLLSDLTWRDRFQMQDKQDRILGDLHVGPLEIDHVRIHSIHERAELAFPAALGAGLLQHMDSAPSQFRAGDFPPRLLDLGPITEQIKPLTMHEGHGRNLKMSVWIRSRDGLDGLISPDLSTSAAQGQAQGQAGLPLGDRVQVHMQWSQPLMQQALEFLVSQEGTLPVNAETALLAKQLALALCRSGVVQHHGGGYSTVLIADHQGMDINSQPAKKAILMALLAVNAIEGKGGPESGNGASPFPLA